MKTRTALAGARQWLTRHSNLAAAAGIGVSGMLLLFLLGDGPSRNDRPAPSSATPAGQMTGMDMTGMDMSGGAVELTTGQLREFGVGFSTVEVRPLTEQVRTVGIVTFDERRLAQVVPRFSGFIDRLYVNYPGQQVRRGQPLLEIYSPELVTAQEELLIASELERTIGRTSVPGVVWETAPLTVAAQQRLRLLDISEAQIEAILRTGRVRRALTLHSPAAGTVVETNAVAGQAVGAGHVLYTIADLTSVWIDAELREPDAANVRVGSATDIQLNAHPGRTFTGRVAYFDPVVDPTARTVKARIEVANRAGLLRPGMYATVIVRTPLRSVLTVPASAAINTGQRTMVFVDVGGGRFVPQDVVLGGAAGDYVEVITGLEPGQRVVTSAQFLLDSESNLGEVMRAMLGQMGTADMGSMPGMDMGR